MAIKNIMHLAKEMKYNEDPKKQRLRWFRLYKNFEGISTQAIALVMKNQYR